MSNIILNLLSLNSNNSSKQSSSDADSVEAFNDFFNPFKKILSTTNESLLINSDHGSLDKDSISLSDPIIGIVGLITQLVTMINHGQFDDMPIDNKLLNELRIKLDSISTLTDSIDLNEANGIFSFTKQLATDLKNLALNENITIADVKKLINPSSLQLLNQSILALKTVKFEKETINIDNNLKTVKFEPNTINIDNNLNAVKLDPNTINLDNSLNAVKLDPNTINLDNSLNAVKLDPKTITLDNNLKMVKLDQETNNINNNLKIVQLDQETNEINNSLKTVLENLLIDKEQNQSLLKVNDLPQKQSNISKLQYTDFYQIINQFNSQVDKLVNFAAKPILLNTSITNQFSIKSKNNYQNDLSTGLSNKLEAPVLMKLLDDQLSWGQSDRLTSEPILTPPPATESKSLLAHDLNINLEDRQVQPSQLEKLQSIANKPYQSSINLPFGSESWHIAFNKQMLHYVKNNIQHAELKLNPKELGTINIQLYLDDNLVKLQIFSGNTTVRNAMEDSMLNLKNSFNEQGFDLSESLVRDQNFSHGNNRDQSDKHSFNDKKTQVINQQTTQSNEQQTLGNEIVINKHKSGIDNFI